MPDVVGWLEGPLTGLSWRKRLAIGVLPYVAVLALMVYLAQRHRGAVLIGAALALMLAVLGMHFLVNHPAPPPFASHLVVAETMMLLGGAGLAVWARTGHPDGIGFAALVTLLIGLGELMSALRDPHEPRALRRHAGIAIIAVCAIAFFVGLALLGTGRVWPAILCVLAVLVSPVGLELTSEEIVDGTALGTTERPNERLFRWATWGGLAAAVAGGILLLLGGAGWLYALVVPIGLFLLVGAIASDTNADLIAVALFALVWLGNTPTPVALKGTLTVSNGDHVVVVLGDSYTSGEGATHYFVNTNTPGVNTCRRSKTAYGANLTLSGVHAGDKTVFLACSGAVADQLWLRSQQPKEPVDWTGPKPSSNLVDGLPQVPSYLRLVGNGKDDLHLNLTPDLVIVGIGGNDANFGTIAQTCLGPGDCSRIGRTWIDHLTKDEPNDPSVRTALSLAFSKIRAAFPHTPVLVVPYPVPIAAHSCWWSPFSNDEHRFLNGFTKDLDAVQEQAAAQAGFMFLDKMETAFADRKSQICGGARSDAAVNVLAQDSVAGTIEQSSNIQNWVHDSMHPKERGQDQMTQVMNAWLKEHPNFDAPAASASSQTAQVRSLDEIMAGANWKPCSGSGEYCRPGATWIGTNARRLIVSLLVPLALIIGGAWACWLALMKRHRARAASGSPGRRQ
jgi:hypothetical protein